MATKKEKPKKEKASQGKDTEKGKKRKRKEHEDEGEGEGQSHQTQTEGGFKVPGLPASKRSKNDPEKAEKGEEEEEKEGHENQENESAPMEVDSEKKVNPYDLEWTKEHTVFLSNLSFKITQEQIIQKFKEVNRHLFDLTSNFLFFQPFRTLFLFLIFFFIFFLSLKCGPIKEVRLQLDNKGNSKGFAHLEFENKVTMTKTSVYVFTSFSWLGDLF